MNSEALYICHPNIYETTFKINVTDGLTRQSINYWFDNTGIPKVSNAFSQHFYVVFGRPNIGRACIFIGLEVPHGSIYFLRINSIVMFCDFTKINVINDKNKIYIFMSNLINLLYLK